MNERTASAAMSTESRFPVENLRAQFPALLQAGEFIFFDNAAGAQIPQQVLDAMNRHLVDHNVQRGGRYARSLAVACTLRFQRSRFDRRCAQGGRSNACRGR